MRTVAAIGMPIAVRYLLIVTTALPLAQLLPVPLFAQTLATASADEEPPAIIVTGAGLPQTAGTPAYGSTVIDRDRLTSAASGRIESALADVAGFQQFRRADSRAANPSAQGATLRALGGNASSRTLVLLDGVPQADPFFGYIPFSAISPDRLGEVRVTRGSGAGAFGAGAVAGTIELVSAARADLADLTGSALYGSANASELSASLTSDLGGGFASVSGRWDRGDGFFTAPASTRTPADVRARYASWSAELRGVVPISGVSEVQARMIVFRDNRTLRFAGADSRSEGQDASVRIVSRGAWAIDAIGYLQLRDFGNVVVNATSLRPTLDQRDTPSSGWGGKIEVRPPVGSMHTLRIGVDARTARGVLFEDALSQATGLVTVRRTAGGATRTVGAFIEDDWAIGRLVITAGARIDRWTIRAGRFAERSATGATITDRRFADRSGSAATLRGGALWRIDDGVSLRAAGYTGFRLPTLNELYRPFVVFPVTTQANPDLGLERLRGFEGGVDFELVRGVRLQATAFHNRLGGAITNVTIGPNLRQRRNVDAITARGVELSGSGRLGALRLAASYALSDARVDASGAAAPLAGKRPAQSPRHAGSATIEWTPRPRLSVSATLRYVSDQFEDDLGTDVLPGVATIDAFAAVPLTASLALVLRGENLTDADVVTRKVGASIDLGTPRTLWLGLRLARQ